MAIKHPQHDLPPDLLNSRLSGASSVWSDDAGLLLLDDFFESASGGGNVGAMASTEVGADVATSSGKVLVKGTLSATDTRDTLSAIGDVFIKGTLAGGESGGDSAVVVGQLLVSGLIDAQEIGQDVAAILGAVPVQGVAAAVEVGNDTAIFTQGVVTSGAMSATEDGDDAFSATVPAPARPGGRGVTVRHQRTKRKPIEIVVDLRTHKDVEEQEEDQAVGAAPVQPAPSIPSLTVAPQPVNVSAVIDAASDAYADAVREYVRGAIAQMVFADAQAREAAELAARAEAEALFQAAAKFARDEDEAASLIMIMAVA